MGIMLKYYCSNCTKVKGEVLTGVGMNYHQTGATYSLYGCKTCGILFQGEWGLSPTIPPTKLLVGDISNPCPKCGGGSYDLLGEDDENSENGEESLSDLICPNCKTGKIILEDVGCWD